MAQSKIEGNDPSVDSNAACRGKVTRARYTHDISQSNFTRLHSRTLSRYPAC